MLFIALTLPVLSGLLSLWIQPFLLHDPRFHGMLGLVVLAMNVDRVPSRGSRTARGPPGAESVRPDPDVPIIEGSPLHWPRLRDVTFWMRSAVLAWVALACLGASVSGALSQRTAV